MRPILAALLAAGCATAPPPFSRELKPCQEDAMALVWTSCLQRTDRPPDIWWVPRAALNCREPGRARGFKSGALCVGGQARINSVDLVWYGDWTRTGLVHEAAHVSRLRRGMDGDPAHLSADFGTDGIVDRCNTLLANAALCAPDRPSEMAITP